MNAESVTVGEANEYVDTATATIAGGEVQQMNNGRAAYRTGVRSLESGDAVAFDDRGNREVEKKSGEVWLDGDEIFWDHSANAATCVPPLVAGDRDLDRKSVV